MAISAALKVEVIPRLAPLHRGGDSRSGGLRGRHRYGGTSCRALVCLEQLRREGPPPRRVRCRRVSRPGNRMGGGRASALAAVQRVVCRASRAFCSEPISGLRPNDACGSVELCYGATQGRSIAFRRGSVCAQRTGFRMGIPSSRSYDVAVASLLRLPCGRIRSG
jgi:hypothetical protein